MDKLKGSLWLIIIAVLVTAISPLAYASGSQRVNTVQIQLKFPDGTGVHPRIEERIRDSIEKVANTLLVGQEVAVIQRTRGEISQVMKVVFNRVLGGFQINDVGLVVGEKTAILLELQPTSTLVERVNLSLHLDGIDDKIVQVANREVSQLSRQVEDLLLGLPIDALVWAQDLIKFLLDQLIQWQLPGFNSKVRLAVDSEIQVDLFLQPRGELVQDLKVNLQTASLPQLIVRPLEKQIERELAIFHGLPVDLLNKYQDWIIQTIESSVTDSKWNRYIYLNSKPEIQIGPTTELVANVDWIDYQIDFIGELNVGYNAPGPALNLSLGRNISNNSILKLNNRVTLDKLTGLWSVSLERRPIVGVNGKIERQVIEPVWTGSIGWRQNQYGFAVSQRYPGGMETTKFELYYYYNDNTQFSINSSLEEEQNSLWLSWQQGL